MPSGIYRRTKNMKTGKHMLGQKLSEETKKKMSETRKGKNNSFFGKHHSEEAKKKMSEANKGHIVSAKTKKKMEGRHNSPATEFKKRQFAGDKNLQWKGGRRETYNGYILIYKPNHPFCNKNKCVFEHRLVAEKHLGRYLTRKETVHHINEIKNDNRIENLMVFVSGGYHTALHRWGHCNPKGIIF